MNRPNRRAALLDLLDAAPPPASQETFWGDLIPRIRQGKLIPLISHSVRGDHIFNVGGTGGTGPPRSSEEDLALYWARLLSYPFPDVDTLARVAQYNLVHSRDTEQAKSRYLLFIKQTLLRLAEQLDPDVAETVAELRQQLDELTFSDIVTDLDYPRFETHDSDSLRLLARLPLPIYLTTSPHNFMERALRAEGRERFRTQVCLWRGDTLQVAPEHRPDPDYIPTPEEPLIYYLYGHEAYPSTMVISEDDYLDFLMRIAQPVDPTRPVIPLYLRQALANSSLLLLGYRLHDWEFRVLFRGLIHAQHIQRRFFSLAIQLDPSHQEAIADVEAARRYLREYFKPARFEVAWSDVDSFVHQLWKEWHAA